MNKRHFLPTCLLAVMLTGCLGRLIADKSMSDGDFKECDALVVPVRSRFQLADFRFPPLEDFMRGKPLPFHDIYPIEQPASIQCHTEVRGLLLTLYTVVELWRVSDDHVQTAIAELIRDERRRLPQAKPTLVRFRDPVVWLVYANVNGSVVQRRGEQVRRAVVIR
jgi:hypothetical protein